MRTLRALVGSVALVSLTACPGTEDSPDVPVDWADAGADTRAAVERDAGNDAQPTGDSGGLGDAAGGDLDAGSELDAPRDLDVGADALSLERDAVVLSDVGVDALSPSLDAAGVDTGTDAGRDAGTDAGRLDAGWDAGRLDAGWDAGTDAGRDAGSDVGRDAGSDVGRDAGSDAAMPLDPCGIDLVRAAPAGTLPTPLRVSGAVVSYVPPATPTATRGVFVQCPRVGPALFLAVDPADTAIFPRPPVAGDEVSFVVTDTAVSASQHRVRGLSGWTRTGSGALAAQDISAVAFPTRLGEFESELINVRGRIAGDRGVAGTGYASYPLATAGVPTAADMLLRMPDAVADALALAPGCNVEVRSTPLWRFNTTTQVMAWQTGEVTVTGCPFRVVSAMQTGLRQVSVTFSEALNPATVAPAGFAIAPGLTIFSTSAAGAVAQLTFTTAPAASTTYFVTVGPSVRSASGASVDPTSNMASFTTPAACPPTTHLVINEIDYDMAGAGADNLEFIEIYNPNSTFVSLDGYAVVLVNGAPTGSPLAPRQYERVELSGTLGAQQYAVITAPASAAGGFALALPPDARRFVFSGTGLTDRLQNGAPDAVVLMRGTEVVDTAVYEGTISSFLPATGMTPETMLSESASIGEDAASPGSLARTPNGCDLDTPASWSLAASTTPGRAN